MILEAQKGMLMKKILFFTLMVLIHVAISLVFNWIFGDSEPLGKTILTSAIFVAIYTAIIYNGEKGKSGE